MDNRNTFYFLSFYCHESRSPHPPQKNTIQLQLSLFIVLSPQTTSLSLSLSQNWPSIHPIQSKSKSSPEATRP